MLTHIAGYGFFGIQDPGTHKTTLYRLGKSLGLKGTLLLGTEGVNFAITGEAETPHFYLETLKNHLAADSFTTNISQVTEHSFNRFMIKIKKEIVTAGLDLQTKTATGPAIHPLELKRWLDEGKDFSFLDTRNDYEVAIGKFEKASHLNVESFREFSEKAKTLPEEIKEKPLVMYCTGGIRCEKSSAQFLTQLGFKEVYKLEGGILNYFKECNEAHWQGDCFVFDDRIAVNPNLEETGAELCEKCQWPITPPFELKNYIKGKYCPNCYKP